MGGEWRSGRLGEFVLLRSGGTPSKACSAFWGGRTPWVSAKDMRSFWIEDSEDHLTSEGSCQATWIVEPGTTLILVRGMTLHNYIPICRVRQSSAFNQDVKAVIPRTDTDVTFVPYLLLGHKERLLALVDSAGHGTGRLNTDTLLTLPVDIPPLREQRAIACILGTLDDKIELNRRMNQTLEGIARAIFKSWFVDFDPVRAKAEGRDPGLPSEIADLFPSSFVDSELGPIPEGWGVKGLSDLIEVNPARTLPRGKPAPYLDMANMPTQGPFPDEWTTRKAGSGMRFAQGDTLVARITPCLENGKTAFVDFLARDEIGWGSTEYIVLRTRNPIPAQFAYLLARTDEFRSFAIQRMTGSSGRQRVPADSLRQLRLAAPDLASQVFSTFGQVITPVFDRMKATASQNRALAALRDTLLPKLISGELRVPDAERIAGRCV